MDSKYQNIYETYKTHIFLAGSVILGAIYRLHHINLRTLWLDEASTANLLQNNLITLWNRVIETGNNSAYMYVIKIWSYIFGDSEIALRSFSTLCGLLAILAIYKLGEKLWSKKTGLWVAFLMSVNFFSIFYSIQARQYSLVVLMSILSIYYFYVLQEKRNWKNALTFITTTAIGIYLHPWFILLLISFVLWTLIKRNTYLLISEGVVLILASPWIYKISMFMDDGVASWIQLTSWKTPIQTLQSFFFGTLGVYIIFVITITAYYTWKRREVFKKQNLILISSLFLLPLIAATIIGHYIPFYVVGRYEAVVLAPLLLLIAWLFSHIQNTKLIIFMCAILAILSFRPIKNEADNIRNISKNEKEIIQEVTDMIKDGDTIIFTSLSRPTFDYYMPRVSQKNVEKISFPKELETHAANQDIQHMIDNKEKYQKEAQELAQKLKDKKRKQVILIFAMDNPINQFLAQELESTLHINKIINTSESGAPLQYQLIFIYTP